MKMIARTITIVLAVLALSSAARGAEIVHPTSCSAPADDRERAQCAALEARILDATVFLRFTLYCDPPKGYLLLPSHATVIDNRSLLTHNHFDGMNDPRCTADSLQIFSERGCVEIVDRAVLDDLVRQLRPGQTSSSAQARAVTFPMPLFAPVPGLTFEAFDSLPTETALAQWDELAEVNWQPFPRKTTVQWVRPLWTERREQAFGLVVGKQTEIGASGGGVFRVAAGEPHHIGNVWGTWKYDDTSLVALNQEMARR